MEARTVGPRERAALYNAAFPARPPLASTDDWITGTWAIGACYKNPNRLYGAFPRGYLERVHVMFPEARRILHAFSGGLTTAAATKAICDSLLDQLPAQFELELVDLKGPEEGRFPTWRGDVRQMPAEWTGRFDLILADPPYSAADAEKYGVTMPPRGEVTRALRRVASQGGTLVWLDVVWPQHRKTEWKTWGHVALVRSTNHRTRLVSFFSAV